jgi:hypothetical protein
MANRPAKWPLLGCLAATATTFLSTFLSTFRRWLRRRRDPAGVRADLAKGHGSAARPGECGQHLAERGVDLDVGEWVAASRSAVDDRYGCPLLPGSMHEPQP